MAQSVMQYVIKLAGNVDSSFSLLGDRLIELGGQIDQISRKLIDFGKQSLDVYSNYELNMAQAEAKYASIYGRDSKQLKAVMDSLNESASYWAMNSIFHTSDVSKAILEAAQAGLNYEQTVEAIPAAMKLAQSGGISLSEAFSLLSDVMNAQGNEWDYAPTLVDHWVYAASRANTTVEELGAAMTKAGATMRFAQGGDAEILALLDALAQSGTKAESAGTLLRNVFLRLISPSEKAKGAIKEFEDEYAELPTEITDDELRTFQTLFETVTGQKLSNLDQAKAAYSALMQIVADPKAQSLIYDETGALRSFIDIFKDMDAILREIYGADYMKNGEALGLLTALFPMRSITGATGILAAIDSGYIGLLEDIETKSGGTADYLVGLVENTFYGQTELFLSKLEELYRTVGGELSGPVIKVMQVLGGVIDKISGLPEGTLDAIISGLTVLAGAGTALTVLGLGLRLIGTLMTPIGKVAAAALVIGSLTAALDTLAEYNFKEKFGDMDLDVQTLTQYVGGINSAFDGSWSNISKFNTELTTSISKYKEASTEFSSKLLTAVLTGNELTDADKAALEALGVSMLSYVQAGITAAGSASTEFIKQLFGEDWENDPQANLLIQMLDDTTKQNLKEAEGISQKIREYLFSAWEDGISEDEYQQILTFMKEYNAAVARAQAEAQDEEYNKSLYVMLQKAQTASYDSVAEMSAQAAAERNKRLALADEQYYSTLWQMEHVDSEEQRNRIMQQYGATSMEAAIEAYKSRYATYRAGISSDYDAFNRRLWTVMLDQGGWDNGKLLVNVAEALGGWAEVKNLMKNALLTGDTEAAEWYKNLAAAYQESMSGLVWNPPGTEAQRSAWGILTDDIIKTFNSQGELAAKAEVQSIQEQFDENPIEARVHFVIQNSGLGGAIAAIFGGKGDDASGGSDIWSALRGYASGGRAAVPSLFGEEGAEWAIPEKHDARTLDLLLAAAYSSGFSLYDLARRAGAAMFAEGGVTQSVAALPWASIVSSGASGAGTEGGTSSSAALTVQYSPVIHAENANGVAEALREDKKRLRKMLTELIEERELYRTVTAY